MARRKKTPAPDPEAATKAQEEIEKLHLRAQKFAAMAADPGPEGRIARNRLERLVEQHPALAYLLIEDAMGAVTHQIPYPHLSRRLLLRELCYRYEVEVGEDAQQIALVGRRAHVQKVLELEADLIPRLERFLYAATLAWMTMAKLPPPLPRSTKPEPEPEPEPEDNDDEVPLAAQPPPEPKPLSKAIEKLLKRAARQLWGA